MSSRRPARAGARLAAACAAALALAGAARAQVLHTEKSLYRNIVVYEADGMRCMKFGRYEGGRQTCASIEHPNHLVFDYTRMMMGALYLNPTPTRALSWSAYAITKAANPPGKSVRTCAP